VLTSGASGNTCSEMAMAQGKHHRPDLRFYDNTRDLPISDCPFIERLSSWILLPSTPLTCPGFVLSAWSCDSPRIHS